MKHIVARASTYLGLLLSVSATTASAQAQASTPSYRWGVIAGMNLATVAGDDVSDASRRSAGIAGILLSVPISSGWSFEPELTYSMKGATTSDGGASASLRTGYVEVPALLRFDVPVAGSVRPFVVGGPAVALRTQCSVEGRSGGTSISMSCAEFERQVASSSVTINTLDVGAMVGGGLAFDVGAQVLTLGARYNMGFVSLTSDGDSKNRVVSFIASLQWPFGHR